MGIKSWITTAHIMERVGKSASGILDLGKVPTKAN